MASSRTPAPRPVQEPDRGLATRRLALIAGVVGLALVVAVLALARSRAPDSAETVTAAGQGQSGAAVGSPLPALEASDLDGQAVNLPSGEPTAVFFFAAWCGTCVPEAATLARLERELGDQVTVVAVDVDPSDDARAIADFLAAAGHPDYPVIHDTTGALAKAFNVKALDVTVIADATGTVVYRDAAPTSEQQLRAALAQAGVA